MIVLIVMIVAMKTGTSPSPSGSRNIRSIISVVTPSNMPLLIYVHWITTILIMLLPRHLPAGPLELLHGHSRVNRSPVNHWLVVNYFVHGYDIVHDMRLDCLLLDDRLHVLLYVVVVMFAFLDLDVAGVVLRR